MQMHSLFGKLLSLLKKPVVVIVILLLALGIGIWNKTHSSSQKATYQTAQVTRDTLVVSVAASGQVTVANKTAVTTGASGVISQVFVKSGDTVSQGDKIAEVSLDATGQQKQAAAWASYLSAKNNLLSQQAQLNTLQVTLFKTNQAFVTDRGVINPSSTQQQDPVYIEENAAWLAAQAAYLNQQSVIAQGQASLTSSWLAYQAASSTITAPSAGTITDLTITLGIPVTGGNNSSSSNSNAILSQQVAAIATDGTPIVSVSLSEVDVPKIQIGQKATLTFDALPTKTYTGKVLGIDTTGIVSSGVTTYPATIVLDARANEILPNMNVTAQIITYVKDNVLLVPSAAIQSSNGQNTVEVLQNGNVTQVPVQVGESSNAQTEVTQGVTEGQEVVTGTIPTGTSSSTGASPFSGGLRGFGGGGGGAVFFRGGAGGGARGN